MDHCPHHRLLLDVVGVEDVVVIEALDLGLVVFAGQVIADGLGLVKALDHNPQRVFAVIQKLDNPCDDADGVDVVVFRCLNGKILLGSEKNLFILPHRRPDSLHRLFPADVKVEGHRREHDDAAHGQRRKDLGDLSSFDFHIHFPFCLFAPSGRGGKMI